LFCLFFVLEAHLGAGAEKKQQHLLPPATLLVHGGLARTLQPAFPWEDLIMNITPRTLLALGTSIALLTASPSWAETPVGPGYGPMASGSGQAPMMRGYGPNNAAGLELTDEQREKMRTIQKDMFKQNMAVMEKMVDEYDQMESLSDADKQDTKSILDAYDRQSVLRRQMMSNRLQAQQKMRDLLTDEQRKAWRGQRGSCGQMGRMGQGYGQMGSGMMMGPGYGLMGPGMSSGMMQPGSGPWWQGE
jgi:Spy/CpxP family protein refolding chaperone